MRSIRIWSRWIVGVSLFTFAGIGAARVASADGRTANELVGEWWTEGNEGRIKFLRARDGSFRGITTCCVPKPPSEDSPQDIHNPNPKLRGRSTIGITIIWGLVYDDGEYGSGYIYNPRDGKTYRFKAELIAGDTLRIRGYLAIPLLGQSQVWKRAEARNSAR